MRPLAIDEPARLSRLREYALLDIERSPSFDRIVELVAQFLEVPRSAISLLDEDRQWFLAKCGIEADETPRDISFCQHTIGQPDDILMVEDAHADPRFCENPLVTGPMAVRFYAGVPLRVPTGERLGALCAIDSRPRRLSLEQQQVLKHLAAIAVDEFELRKALRLMSVLVDDKDRLTRELEARSAQALEAAARAERLSRGKSQFLANMSHEIRTPMNGVLGMAEALVRSGLSEQQKEMAETLFGCAEGLLGILNDILDLSKLEEGRIRLESLRVDLEALTGELARLHRVRAQEKGIRFEVRVDPKAYAVLGDPTRIRQILHNLLGNAVKFTDRGSVTLEVMRVRDFQGLVACLSGRAASSNWQWLVPLPGACGHDYLGIAVSDTGIGMDRLQLARLGEAYAQADDSITRRFGGTGLGLSISAKLAGCMGGGLALASTPGHGTIAALLLALPSAPGLPASASCAPRPELQRPMRVLLAEDNEVNRQVAAMHLKAMQCTHVHVWDGAAAVHEALRSPFDLILMDLQMPVVSGIEAIMQIRAQPGPNRDTPIIALTASVMVEEQARVKRAGADEILGKPYRRDALVAVAARAAGSEICFDAAYWAENFHDVEAEDCRALLASALESWAGLRRALDAVPEGCPSGVEVASIAHRAGGSCGLIGYRMAAAKFLQWERSARALQGADIDRSAELGDIRAGVAAELRALGRDVRRRLSEYPHPADQQDAGFTDTAMVAASVPAMVAASVPAMASASVSAMASASVSAMASPSVSTRASPSTLARTSASPSAAPEHLTNDPEHRPVGAPWNVLANQNGGSHYAGRP